VDIREVLNGLRYLTRGSTRQSLLPHDFPPTGARAIC
jgi:hypothetical protein